MLPKQPSPWRGVGEVAQIGMTLVVATMIGLGGGYLLDRWLMTLPWLSVVGLVFGIAAGFVKILRTARAIEREQNQQW